MESLFNNGGVIGKKIVYGESLTGSAGFPYTLGFEDGSFGSEWIKTNNFNIVTSPVRTGSYAAGNTGSTIDAELDLVELFGLAYQFDEIEFYWYELSNQSGFTVEFVDSSNNVLFQAGGNNPQWEIEDADGSPRPYGGDGYERWILYRFTFDWSNGQYSYFMEDTSTNSTASDSNRNMFYSTDIAKIRINNANGGWGNAAHMYFDDFKFSYSG